MALLRDSASSDFIRVVVTKSEKASRETNIDCFSRLMTSHTKVVPGDWGFVCEEKFLISKDKVRSKN